MMNPAAPGAVSAPASRKWQIDGRYIAPLFITMVLLVGQYFGRILESYPKTFLAIGCSIATEIALGLIVYKKLPHLASAYVSGISVGILVRSPYVWPYAVIAVIAIMSKYVLRVKGRHIWNPSNFGIAVMLLLAPAAVTTLSIQFGSDFRAMLVIWTLGAFIVSRLHRLHICATYVASFFAFAFLRSLLTGHTFAAEAAPITGPMYQLFIFFMITDPKSTVTPRWGQCLVAFCVALAESVLRLLQNVHAPYYALFLVGPAANLIEIWWNGRRGKSARQDALAGAGQASA